MSESPLRKNQAVNFRIYGEDRLLHFLNDWIELEVSKVFRLVVITPGNGTPNIVQAVPTGESASEDESYFHLLERSLGDGQLQFWKENAEFLPRLEAVLGIPATESA